MKANIMAHMVAWYPDKERSFEVAKSIIDGGAAYLELQFPFSDPSADGPAIQKACQDSLDAGFSVDEGFALVRRIKEYSDIPVYVMSYGNIVFTRGIEVFVKQAKDAGVSGLIIPDLPYDLDEGLYETGKKHGVIIVPVVVPTLSDARLEGMCKAVNPEYIYAALRVGITGTHTEVDAESLGFLEKLKKLAPNAKILAGFGIDDRSQVEALYSYSHALVVGSAFVRVITKSIEENTTIYDSLKAKVRSLSGE